MVERIDAIQLQCLCFWMGQYSRQHNSSLHTAGDEQGHAAALQVPGNLGSAQLPVLLIQLLNASAANLPQLIR
jgi:hypothetical protein